MWGKALQNEGAHVLDRGPICRMTFTFVIRRGKLASCLHTGHAFNTVKIAFSMFTAIIVLVSSISNGVLYVGFKLTQAEIEQLYCVNKAPQKQCHGKCRFSSTFYQPLSTNINQAAHVQNLAARSIKSPVSDAGGAFLILKKANRAAQTFSENRGTQPR